MSEDKIAQEIQKQSSEFDLSTYMQLEEDTSAEVALKILARFFDSIEDSKRQISYGVKSETSEPAWRACHKLAGSAELLGFVQFSKDARLLSKSLQASLDLGSHEDELKNVITRLSQISSAIEKAFPDYRNYL